MLNFCALLPTISPFFKEEQQTSEIWTFGFRRFPKLSHSQTSRILDSVWNPNHFVQISDVQLIDFGHLLYVLDKYKKSALVDICVHNVAKWSCNPILFWIVVSLPGSKLRRTLSVLRWGCCQSLCWKWRSPYWHFRYYFASFTVQFIISMGTQDFHWGTQSRNLLWGFVLFHLDRTTLYRFCFNLSLYFGSLDPQVLFCFKNLST